MSWNGYISNKIISSHRFARFVMTHFLQDDCTYIASALAFTSILAIVPLMSVGLAIFSIFPVFQSISEPMQTFIFHNFIPSTGAEVQNYLQQFTLQATKLPLYGIGFLLIMALLLMLTIEQAMNKIWRVNASRHGVTAFLLYWTILSLAPILLGLSVIGSSYLLLLLNHPAPSFFLHSLPFILSLIGFIFLYTIVPNCHVKFRHAFAGSFFAAICFELAKLIFACYLNHFNAYELLYGAFATIPIFFIWVYWTWVITLVGAEISYAFSVHHQRRNGHTLDGFSHALLWLNHLWRTQQQGKGLTFNELIDISDRPFAIDADEMINTLIHHELIHCSANGHYMLSREMSQISLYHLTQILPYRLPTQHELHYIDKKIHATWNVVLKKNDLESQKILNTNLEQLFKME